MKKVNLVSQLINIMKCDIPNELKMEFKKLFNINEKTNSIDSIVDILGLNEIVAVSQYHGYEGFPVEGFCSFYTGNNGECYGWIDLTP